MLLLKKVHLVEIVFLEWFMWVHGEETVPRVVSFQDDAARRAGAKASLAPASVSTWKGLVAEPAGQADLSARRDRGLQTMLPGPHSKAVSSAILPEHPGRVSGRHH